MNYSEEEATPRLTLEGVLGRLHQEIGKTIVSIGNDLINIPDFVSNFLQGRGGWGEYNAVRHQRALAIGYRDLIERAESLFEQAEDIWLEKGYRHSGSLLTGREHKEVGSSGYGKFFEAMPDTVVSIANQTLRLEEEKEPMTMEEIRRARILYGMPTIDDTGTVTEEIVPITGPYHFLTEERTAEVKRLEQQIISGIREIVYEAIARRVVGFVEYKRLVQTLAEGKITTLVFYAELEKLKIGDLKGISDDARKVSYLDGRRDDILTPMELMILGRGVDEKYKTSPYKPLGVQKGELSIQKANQIRAEERFFDLDTYLFTGYEYPFSLSLEPLNKEGQTERGPLVLDRITKEPLDDRAIQLFKGRVGTIPFTRPTDWYHREAT